MMDTLNAEEGKLAVSLARHTLLEMEGSVKTENPELPAVFDEFRGVFVTLKKQDDLRGCIGFPYPIKPLKEAITTAAIAAASEDPRFSPVKPEELDLITIEVTILTPPIPLTCEPDRRTDHVIVGKHGLIVSGLHTGGLLLPQVATEYGWDAGTFLDHTCIKAGLPPGCWKNSSIEVQIFEGQIFHE